MAPKEKAAPDVEDPEAANQNKFSANLARFGGKVND